ncbi:MAG: HAD family hydrolase [Candidatus Helarchaeota archaeon]
MEIEKSHKMDNLKKVLSNIKVIIFDLEGTILEMDADWEKMRKKISDYFLENFNIKLEFKPILLKIDEALELLSKKRPINELKQIKEHALNIIEETHINAAKNSTLFDGIKDLLKKLKKLGYQLVVFTRSGKKSTKILLEKNGLNKFFKIVITREDTEHSKPSSEGIIKIMNFNNFNPDKYLIIGDHPYDIISGKNANIHTLGVLSGIASKDDLIKVRPEFILNNIVELLDYLD